MAFTYLRPGLQKQDASCFVNDLIAIEKMKESTMVPQRCFQGGTTKQPIQLPYS